MSVERYRYYTRMMLGGAALILAVTALMHGSRFFVVDEIIAAQTAMPDPWRDDVRALWLVYSVHLLLLAGLVTYAALHPTSIPGAVLVFCGLFPAADALLLVVFIGGVYGNVLLTLASVLVLGAAARGNEPIAHPSQS